MLHRINLARRRWGAGRFTTGDCHTLAMALHEAGDRTGTLLACLYGSLESYSHMVLLDRDGRSWDVHGEGAQQRWQARMTSPVCWAPVPCADLDYKDTKRWLRVHNARLNTPLQRKLVELFSAP